MARLCKNNGELFQVPIDHEWVKSWTPLKCTTKDPKNCSVTALSLMKLISKDIAQKISDEGMEKTGIMPKDYTRLMKQVLKHWFPKYHAKLQTLYDLKEMNRVLAELKEEHMTPIAVTSIRNTGPVTLETFNGHVNLLARSGGKVQVIEGQVLRTFDDEEANEHLKQYHMFMYWCLSDTPYLETKKLSPKSKSKYFRERSKFLETVKSKRQPEVNMTRKRPKRKVDETVSTLRRPRDDQPSPKRTRVSSLRRTLSKTPGSPTATATKRSLRSAKRTPTPRTRTLRTPRTPTPRTGTPMEIAE